MKFILLLFILVGCSSHMIGGEPREGKRIYSFTDGSGRLKLSREIKTIKNTLVTRNQYFSPQNKLLEKSVIVSHLGTFKSKKNRVLTVRPEASEYQVWLDGKKYTSEMKINEKSKSMIVTLDSPETKWKGSSEHKFPKGKYFCFFNQIAECLYRNNLLEKAFKFNNRKIDFYIVWDGYPFIQDLYTGIGGSLFSPASLTFEGPEKNTFRYIIEVDGQSIVYTFSKSYDLEKIAWITQGIVMVPPGEEIPSDE